MELIWENFILWRKKKEIGYISAYVLQRILLANKSKYF